MPISSISIPFYGARVNGIIQRRSNKALPRPNQRLNRPTIEGLLEHKSQPHALWSCLNIAIILPRLIVLCMWIFEEMVLKKRVISCWLSSRNAKPISSINAANSRAFYKHLSPRAWRHKETIEKISRSMMYGREKHACKIKGSTQVSK